MATRSTRGDGSVTGRDDLLHAIDNLARAVHSGRHKHIEACRRNASALAVLLVPTPQEHVCSHCGIAFGAATRLAEHVYVIHDGPRPAHWREAERDA